MYVPRLLASIVGALLLLAAGACTTEASRPAPSQEVDMKTVVMPVEGMSCSACVARVKKALNSIDGVSDVQVNLVERNARVRFAPSSLGYQAGPATEAK